jgi:hypothetical protein
MNSEMLTEAVQEEAELLRPDAQAVAVYCWRVEQLERAGYTGAFAHMLAEDTDVDLHLACDLIARGCSESTAYAILS